MIELKFRNVDFCGGRNKRSQRKTLKARERINIKLISHVMQSLGIKPEISDERQVSCRYATHASP
jgi:hypothetical protein